MYYYKEENEYIIKYDVKLDEKKLKELKLEIIEKCSYIIHKHYNTTKTPNYFDFEHIRNYKEKFLRWIEYNDFYSSDEEEYEVEYDYYEHDDLVKYIDLLLHGDTSSIDLIMNLNDKKYNKEKSILKKQRKIINKLYNDNDNDIKSELDELISIQKELEEYKKEQELNKNQISSLDYKDKVIECITLNEIARLLIEDVNKYQIFFDIDKDNVKSKSLRKILK